MTRSNGKPRPVLTFLSLLLLLPAAHSRAVDRFWIDDNGGRWHTPGNWSGGVVPSPEDRGVFNLRDPGYTVTIDADVLAGVAVLNDIVTFQLAGSGLGVPSERSLAVAPDEGDNASLTVRGGALAANLDIGAAGNGSLWLTDGLQLYTSQMIFGRTQTGSGSLRLSGPGTGTPSNANASPGDLTLGDAGRGFLTLESGANLRTRNALLAWSPTGIAVARVTGIGSNWETNTLSVGVAGKADLAIDNGATVSGFTYLGRAPTASGHVTVAGPGSTLAGFVISVGEVGAGTLTITGGGRATGEAVIDIGDDAGSRGDVLVTGPGSEILSQAVHVGRQGTGSLTLQDGAFVKADHSVMVAVDQNSSGQLHLSGPGTRLTTASYALPYATEGPITIARRGRGSLTVRDGATASGTFINFAAFPSARADALITGAGSAVSSTFGGIYVGGDVLSSSGIADVTVTDHASLVSADVIRILSGSTLTVADGANTSSFLSTVVRPGGLLLVRDGTVRSNNDFVNGGETRLLGDGKARVSGLLNFVNDGLLYGNGRVDMGLVNNAAGEVRAAAGERLLFASSTPVVQAGRLTLSGGTMEFAGPVNNAPAGRISGRGTFIAPQLNNSGQVQLSAGISDFYSPLTNNSGAKVFVGGGASATFYKPVNNLPGSEFHVFAGSTATFFDNVSGDNFFTGGGMIHFADGHSSAGPIAMPAAAARVGRAATLEAGAVDLMSLRVEGTMVLSAGASPSRVAALHLESSATLDLTDNSLIVDHDGASPIKSIREAVASAYAGGSWSGPGITSSIAAGDPAQSTAIGYAEAADVPGARGGSFEGERVDATSVLIRLTKSGDANLDGIVGFVDLVSLAQNYGGTDKLWSQGDFDFDGTVNFTDLVALARNYATGPPAPADLADQFGSAFAADLVLAQSQVPEPVSAAALLLAAVLSRRRLRILQAPVGILKRATQI